MSAMDALEKLGKWRRFFAGWQLGTTSEADGAFRAVSHHREATLITRVELSAVINILIAKGIITETAFEEALGEAAAELDASFERMYAGFSSSPDGMKMKFPEARVTMKTLNFPPLCLP